MAEEAQSPSKVSNDDLVEHCLILVQQLFAEQRINDQERDHLKGKQTFWFQVMSANHTRGKQLRLKWRVLPQNEVSWLG
jgi:hypothetical protein